MSESTDPPELTPQFKKTPEYYEEKGIQFTQGTFTNSKGWRLQTFCWKPKEGNPKALVFVCHGYAVDCGTYAADLCESLAFNGYTVHGMDYQGFGQSEGLRGMFNSVDDLADDVMAYYGPIRDAPENASLAKFLCGESMGGAVALKIHLRDPDAWRGAVLVAPMCKIASEQRPSYLAELLLRGAAWLYPTWAIVPVKDLSEYCNEDPAKRELIRSNPLVFKGCPRLCSALAMLAVTEELEKSLGKVSWPFLLLHGDADTVTDPAISQALFDQSCSSDKTFKLYPGMWHSLIFGAFPHNSEIVLKDIVAWLDKRCSV